MQQTKENPSAVLHESRNCRIERAGEGSVVIRSWFSASEKLYAASALISIASALGGLAFVLPPALIALSVVVILFRACTFLIVFVPPRLLVDFPSGTCRYVRVPLIPLRFELEAIESVQVYVHNHRFLLQKASTGVVGVKLQGREQCIQLHVVSGTWKEGVDDVRADVLPFAAAVSRLLKRPLVCDDGGTRAPAGWR